MAQVTIERCDEILKEPNRDLDSVWTCELCGKQARRAHFVAGHIRDHLLQLQARPKVEDPTLDDGLDITWTEEKTEYT